MYCLVLITAKNKNEARNIAKALLNKRLAACVNILDKVESLFWWKGKIDSAFEAMLIVKSKGEKLPKIIKMVKSLHSYSVPEIIALPVSSGFKPYLEWINESIR